MYTRLVEFSTLDDECPYIKTKAQRVEYKYINNCTKEYANLLTSSGFRRFGNFFSRPICIGCDDCLSIRIDAKNYIFSKSARRIIKKNEDTKIVVQKPTYTQKHVNLYNKFHQFKETKNDWKYNETNFENYYTSFVEGHKDFGKEVLFFRDEKLVGVDLIDILHDGISSIYFFYDPDYMHLALGKYSLYRQIDLVKRLNLDWVYLGYYVKECASLKYKGEYKPYQTLINKTDNYESSKWDFVYD